MVVEPQKRAHSPQLAAGSLNGKSFSDIGNSTGVRLALGVITFAFLGANLFFRFCTIFDYSRFIQGLFMFLGICSLFVILFPKYLRTLLFFFGSSFFLFGFRGYDIQSQVFETIVAFVAMTVFFVNLRSNAPAKINQHLAGVLLCYIGLSMFSLLLLPVGHIIKSFWFFGLKTSFLQIANTTPNTYVYPLAGINRLILFSFFALEVLRAEKARELFKWVFIGVFAGGVFCAFIGLLDYYGIISLAWYRFGGTATPGALHSTFLNRGWFAEFILTAVPFVLLGFMSKIKGLWWKILLLSSLVICEIALILAGARAGWVSYPLILFICWLFFYFSKEGRVESFHFRWRDIVKVAISVPITIVISFLLIFYVLMPLSDYFRNQGDVKAPGKSSKSTSQYIERQTARLIKPSKGGRTYTWGEGFNVGKESPVFGMGYESFNWHANILSTIPDSYYHKFYSKLKYIHDTPHNVFFQIFVSGGAVGFCLWVLIIGYGLMILIVDLVKNKRLLNTPVIISIISFHIYGIFQSMQYIPMIWMLIFLSLGYAMTIEDNVLPVALKKITGILVKVSMIIVVIGLFVYLFDSGSKSLAEKYGLKIYAKDQERDKYVGFYHREKWPTGYYRWSGRKAMAAVDGSGVIELDFQCDTPRVEKEPIILLVSLDGKRIDKVRFARKGEVKRRYYLEKNANEENHRLLFDVSRTWNPKRLGVSADVRELGVAMSEVRLLERMPKDGIGFYDWDTWGGIYPGGRRIRQRNLGGLG